jgi:hypothetical protein
MATGWIARTAGGGSSNPETVGNLALYYQITSLGLRVHRQNCAVTAALLRDRTDTQPPPPAQPGQRPPADPGMIPLTIPEIKHLLAALLLWHSPPGHTAYCLDWRRRHQARSRWYHQRTRLTRNAEIILVS